MKAIWMPVATSYVGTKEIRGSKDNPIIVQFFDDVDAGWVKDDETPWCAAFVGAMLQAVGITETGSLAARSYMKWGKATKKPVYGDVVVFYRGKRSGWQGHVAFFVKEDARYVWVLGGNQRNSVNVTRYPKAKVLGYRKVPSMGRSRTVAGSAVAGAGIVAAPVVGMISEAQQTFSMIDLSWAPMAVAVLALCGLAYMLYARYTDMKIKGR